jgi:Na+-driven multidrug efflux pump
MMGLRGSGDAMTPFWFMILSVMLDSGFNPVLISGSAPFPRMGIAGSATATLIAQLRRLAGLLATVYIRDLPIRLRGRRAALSVARGREMMRTIVAKGLPMGAQMLVMSLASLTMVGLVNRLGVDTAAAYGVSQQLWTYIQMPAMAIGAAVSGDGGAEYRRRRWDRVNGITRAGLAFNCCSPGRWSAPCCCSTGR